MKKGFKTFIQEDSITLKTIVVSAGKIGLQIELDPQELQKITSGEFENIIQ